MDSGSDRRVRTLVGADVAAAVELSYAAGWNQTAGDWQRLIDLEPEGCLGIECDGRLVATTTLLCYGRELAWVGMVLTHADHQRRGYARQLVQRALDIADARGIGCVKLDATDQGRPLYAALGFRDEQPVERWRRDPEPVTNDDPDLRLDAAIDRRAFGADRARFLDALDWRMQRPGLRARYLGPCVFASAAEAGRSIRSITGAYSDAWFWDILPANAEAVRMAREMGFAPARKLVRMSRGGSIRGDDSLVYAIGGFEAG